MRRTLLLAATLTVALPATAAQAAVIPDVSGDTLTVTGDAAADTIDVRVRSQTEVEVNGTVFDRGGFSKIAIRSGGGDDTIRIAHALTEAVTIEAGPGADAVTGGPGAETILAGDGADLVQPGGGDDDVLLGTGDDTALQGDGADDVDGQAGADTLTATGSGESEEFTLQADGAQALVSRDTRPGTTRSRGVERLEVLAAGGPDLVDVGDLSATEVTSLDADLGLPAGERDRITLQGTDAQIELLDVEPAGDAVRVDGLEPVVRIANARAADDRLTVLGGGGVDFVEADRAVGERIALTLDGGAGDDSLDGSDAADELRGGPGRDTVTGRRGDDVADLGDGDDSFHRVADDGRDRVEGGAGEDRLAAGGSGGDDTIDVQRLLSRTRLRYGFTGQADMGSVETVAIDPFGGTDRVTALDLAGTATHTVDLHMASADARVDTAVVGGSQGADTLRAATSGDVHTVTGAATVRLVRPEQGTRLLIDGGNGDDTVDASGLVKDRLQPELRGSAGKDIVVGSPGQDVAGGGIGDDVVFLAGGLDTATWGPGEGSDIVEGGAGTDFLSMTGSGAAERFEVAPVGGRALVLRDVDGVRLDTGDVERLDLLPGTGPDTVQVRDLSGTDVTHVDVALARARATTDRDGAADSVLVDGTNGVDSLVADGAGPEVRLSGLAAVTIARFADPALDRMHVDTKAGIDSVSVTGSTLQLLAFGFSQ